MAAQQIPPISGTEQTILPGQRIVQLRQLVAGAWHSRTAPVATLRSIAQSIRAAARTGVFFLKVMPMLPSRALDWVTPPVLIEQVQYPTVHGPVEGDLYRPSTGGRHPGMVVCLGVVPFGVDHPQVPRLGKALARSGFTALLYWSPAMRDLCLDPEDSASIALAYRWLVEQPYVDPAHSGLLGTCVGGSFALLAAAQPCICDRVAFVATFAPFTSMWTLVRDIAGGTRSWGKEHTPWPVDPLTHSVYIRTLTAGLDASEAERLRTIVTDPEARLDPQGLSAAGQAIWPLLTTLDVNEIEPALRRLPSELQARLSAMSPLEHIQDVHAPLITVGHDRDDLVIPVGESRRLSAALSGRAGLHYTEFGLFQHADPTKRRLSPLRMARELGKFFLYVYPVYRQAETA